MQTPPKKGSEVKGPTLLTQCSTSPHLQTASGRWGLAETIDLSQTIMRINSMQAGGKLSQIDTETFRIFSFRINIILNNCCQNEDYHFGSG